MKKLKCIEKVFLYLALPFSIVRVALKLLLMPSDRNAFHTGKKLSGIKKASISKDILLEDLKVKSRILGVTINDLLMTLTSVSLHEYLRSKGDLKTNSLHFSMPISLREAPNSADEFELINNFAMVSIKLDLVDNFEKGLK